jgi:CPA1 family monovalent cation:H+ antiporter
VKILTWGGLRGGLSLAMAMALGPQIDGRQTIQAITYSVAVFSIAAQGLTFGRLVRSTAARNEPTSLRGQNRGAATKSRIP